jgi:uncharacterized SAM-binding protein YcdF (DUF218 family)
MVALKNAHVHPLLNSLIVILFMWLAGLLLFARDVNQMPEEDPQHVQKADGIVVLTGGSARVPAGLDLLVAGAAPKLLISGVDPRVEMNKILPENHPARNLQECCITLGTYAEDTYGNAVEAAAWAKKYKMKSLIVVTANYHMRRALLEFTREAPRIILIPYPINPHNLLLHQWTSNPGTASLLMEEYQKLMLGFVKAFFQHLFQAEPAAS